MKRFTKVFCTAAMASVLMPALAGNVPQYRHSQIMADKFEPITDGVQLKSLFENFSVIFPDKEVIGAYSGQGFPIGFDFRYAGKVCTQFAVTNNGVIYLGDDEGIEYRGRVNQLFINNWDKQYNDSFYLGANIEALCEPTADISYKLMGEPGDRVLVIQYLGMQPENQPSTMEIGIFDLQIRLYERTGAIEYAINEIETPEVKDYYFNIGMRGWETEDALLLQANTIGEMAWVGPVKANPIGLEFDPATTSRVKWNSDDYNNYYKPVYRFEPVTDAVAPSGAPTELKATQVGRNLNISCRRAEGADATVVLVSNQPFTASDFPTDGHTFRVKDNVGEFVSHFGAATAVYYDNDEVVNVTMEGLENGKDYYVVALSANGYPAFNTSDYASVELVSAQAGPSAFMTTGSTESTISFRVDAQYPVIITATGEVEPIGLVGYQGVFGRPDANAQVGDVVEGGGTVVYNGPVGNIEVEPLRKNGINYFAAWTVKDGRLSAEPVYSYGTTTPSFPYEPALEDYPTLMIPSIVSSNMSDGEYLGAFSRYLDNTFMDRCVRMKLVAGQPVEFLLPHLSMREGGNFSFQFALETDRGVDETAEVPIPLGNEPGHFDSGSLDVICSDGLSTRVLGSVKEYHGTMMSNGDNGYVSQTSSFEDVDVAIPALGHDERLGLRANVDIYSLLYFRGIKITSNGSGAQEIPDLSEMLAVSAGQGELTVMSPVIREVKVYGVDGRLAATAIVNPETPVTFNLPAGIYLLDGHKVMVK